MSSVDATARHGARVPPATTSLGVTQLRVLRSEWTKLRSLHSTVYTLVAAVVLTVGLGALFSAVSSDPDGEDSFRPGGDATTLDPILTSLNGITFSQLAIGVLGVLLMSGEYSSGMIRSSLTAVPKRLPVLWGKLMVFAGVVFLVGLATSFVSFTLGQALLGDLGVALGAEGAVRSVVGAALYLTVVGMIGVALGTLLRNTAAGISTLVGVFFLLPPLTMLLPASVSTDAAKYLPSNAGGAVFGAADTTGESLTPWTGFALLCAYAFVLIAGAAVSLRRRDA